MQGWCLRSGAFQRKIPRLVVFETDYEKDALTRVWQRVAGLTEDHCRVDLAVSVGGAVALAFLHEVLRGHCYHHCLLLQSVDVLDNSPSHQVLPTKAHTHREGLLSMYIYLQANVNETAMHRKSKQIN